MLTTDAGACGQQRTIATGCLDAPECLRRPSATRLERCQGAGAVLRGKSSLTCGSGVLRHLGSFAHRMNEPRLTFATQSEWDAWLEAHGSASLGVWLRLAKRSAEHPTV